MPNSMVPKTITRKMTEANANSTSVSPLSRLRSMTRRDVGFALIHSYCARPVAERVTVMLLGRPGNGFASEKVLVTDTVTVTTSFPPPHVAVQVLGGVVGVKVPALVAHWHDSDGVGVGPVVSPFAMSTAFAALIIPVESPAL